MFSGIRKAETPILDVNRLTLLFMKKICLIFFSLFFSLSSCSNNSEPVKLDDVIDTKVPSIPTNLSSSNIMGASADLSWSASTDNVGVTNYKVYQDGSEIAEVTSATYSVTGLNGATMYSFTVSAIDAEGNESAESLAISITTDTPTDTEAPSVPTDLSSSNVTRVSVDLSWEVSTDNVGVIGYKMYQGGSEIAQVAGTAYSVANLNASTTYSFTVSAVDAEGNESAESSAESITTITAGTKSKVLVFTKTAGFNHGTESESVAMVQQIASSQNFDVVVDNDGSEFNMLANLNQYKIIFFANTSGNTLTDAQRSNVENYAAQGGNFISNHAASDSYGHSTASTISGNGKGLWDWYAENITGCSVRNGPNHTSNNFGATVSVENQNTQLTGGISFPWNDNEEWYYWEGGYLNNSFTELLRVSDTGSNSYDDARMTAQYWERSDGGISFYSSMGHAESKYSDSDFVQLMDNTFDFILN